MKAKKAPKNLKNREKLSGVHFVDLLNEITLNVPSGNLRSEDKLRIQILLLHLYVDYLMIIIFKEISPHRKKSYKNLDSEDLDTYAARLELLKRRRTLSTNGYLALKWLNTIRNIIAHKYNFQLADLDSILNKIKKKFGHIISASFNQANIEGKLSLVCMLYINSLRQYILKKSGVHAIDTIRVIPSGNIIKYAWIGSK